MPCPDENVLAAYVDNGLGRERRAELERHMDDCASCRAIVSGLAQTEDAAYDETIDTDHTNDETLDNSLERTAWHGGGRPSAQTIDSSKVKDRAVHVVPGTMVGEYEIIGPLGAGGMGAVFAAIHPRIGKKAAIKVLQRQLARDPASLVRFENEARAVNAIGHPNLVDIFAFGELPDGNPYFVMEHVEGESLDSWLQRRRVVSLDVAMPILRQIIDALAAAHERGIIHRDLKPANVMVSNTDSAPRVKVLDFGLAKIVRRTPYDPELTDPGVAMGTPYFMSPEQHLGDGVDHRTDIYALGVLAYQMLTGRYPFLGDTPTELGVQHLHVQPLAPSSIVKDLPAGLDDALVKALAKNPRDRYSTVREFEADLDACLAASAPAVTLASGPSSVLPSTPLPVSSQTEMIQQRAGARPPWIWISAAVVLAAAVVAIWIVVKRPDAASERTVTPTAPAITAAPSDASPVTVEPIKEPDKPAVVETEQPPTKPVARVAKPKPKVKPDETTGSATTKPACNPLRSLDGC